MSAFDGLLGLPWVGGRIVELLTGGDCVVEGYGGHHAKQLPEGARVGDWFVANPEGGAVVVPADSPLFQKPDTRPVVERVLRDAFGVWRPECPTCARRGLHCLMPSNGSACLVCLPSKGAAA